jgi:glycosyltransferase involved in cell wall biosynthesis
MLNPPYFSICIPQYNRTDFLIEACRTFAAQSFRNFELCISDDCSDDGKEHALLEFLTASGLTFNYRRSAKNLRYDGNLRAAIEMSKGNYLLLMGNDDGLAGPDALQCLHDELERVGGAAVAIANYREVSTGQTYRRMSRTAVLGSGPVMAAAAFRDYSFVSGVVLDGTRSREASTAVVDGSEMYQMYLGTLLVAEGGRFLSIADVLIHKDLQVQGQTVDSYRRKPRLEPCPIMRRPLPMGRLLEVVVAGLRPAVSNEQLDFMIRRIGRDLYLYTYAFWAVEFRRVQSWKYSLGVLLALSPSHIAGGQPMRLATTSQLWALYAGTLIFGLLTPIRAFDALRPFLYFIAKRPRK